MSVNGDTIVRADPYIFPVLAELIECTCAELSATGAGPLCWCGLYPGAEVSWEFCGDCGNDLCGMAWARGVSVFPYEVFPNQATDFRCNLPLAWQVEVGALRCLPVLPDGEIPDPDTMAVIVSRQTADAFAIYRALNCCAEFGPVAIQAYTPAGPEGGCVGGSWTAFLAVD